MSKAIISGQAEEADEETAALMTMDEPPLHEESFSVPEAEEITKAVPEPFLEEVFASELHEAEEVLER